MRFQILLRQRPASFLQSGTAMKGLNVFAGKQDPVALKDEEYPDWLWTLLDKPEEENKLSREYLRKASKQKIKENARTKAF